MNALTTEFEKASKDLVRSIGRDASETASLREFIAHQSARDPSKVAWPSTLIMELALKTASPKELKEHYGFDDDEWLALRENPVFIRELSAMCETVKQDGMSFKMKARLQAEGMLETNWRLIHAPTSEVPAAVKARMMETTFRMAGYDSKGTDAAVGAAGMFNIQINLGG